jgi:hypothetical protein
VATKHSAPEAQTKGASISPIAESVEVQPYSVEIPQAELEDLEARLARVRWPNELQGVDWS